MAQKFITKEVVRRMSKYPLYSQDGKAIDAVCTAKFFLPCNAWTWYVLEYDTENEDTCFGIVINGYGEGEYGYFSLKGLQNIRGQFGLKVERDMYFTPIKIGEIRDGGYMEDFLKNYYESKSK